ncbi:hypothetical protein [Desulfofundulus sp.]|uniref:hypothetical protein n=1 Tax=Desulfofundulus sp. TaxID=2282750 RepID=UPI003C71FC4A
MYFRFPVIADLCAHALSISKTELAARLKIAVPTLNAYRAHTRFPRESEASGVCHAVARVLFEAAGRVSAGLYVMSCMAFDEKLSFLYRRGHYSFPMSVIAGDIVYHYLSKVPKGVSISGKEALDFLMSQDPARIPELLLWLLAEYCETIDVYRLQSLDDGSKTVRKIFPPPPLLHCPLSYLDIYAEYAGASYRIAIPFPFCIDVLMLTVKKISFDIESEPLPGHRKLTPILKFEDLDGNTYTCEGVKSVTYHHE